MKRKSGEGQYWGYYVKVGRGKKKVYKCVFESCDHHTLPSYSGITSHLERTHGHEIDEEERNEREWKEEEQREKKEKIERERRAEKFAEQQLREFKRMLPQIKEQNRLKKERQEKQRRIEEEERQRRIEKNREICNKIWEAHANGASFRELQIIYLIHSRITYLTYRLEQIQEKPLNH